MQQNQQEDRGYADKEFMESLEQLEDILQESMTEAEVTPEADIASVSDSELVENLTEIDLAAFEDAVADIEQYLEEKTKKPMANG